MRRAGTQLVLGLVLGAVAMVAGAGSAHAQQDENETGELDPADVATTLAEEPVEPGEVVVVDSTTPPLSPDSTVPPPTTVPVGCDPPLPPQAVFTARLVVADARTGRFEIDDVRAGSLEGYRVGALVDVTSSTTRGTSSSAATTSSQRRSPRRPAGCTPRSSPARCCSAVIRSSVSTTPQSFVPPSTIRSSPT